MAVTTSQIRDLLNRPRGLNDGTVTEYITIRTAQVNKQVQRNRVQCLANRSTTGN